MGSRREAIQEGSASPSTENGAQAGRRAIAGRLRGGPLAGPVSQLRRSMVEKTRGDKAW